MCTARVTSEAGHGDASQSEVGLRARAPLLHFFTAPPSTSRRLRLVAMSCFLIAAKFEEAEENVPSAHAVNQYANEAYQPRLLHHMEILILRTLDWSLTATTALHFLGAFHAAGILFSSDTMAYRPLVADVPRYLQRYTDFFADLALQGAWLFAGSFYRHRHMGHQRVQHSCLLFPLAEYSFQQHLPSHLAAAIVLAARKSLVIRCVRARELVRA